MKKIVVRRLIFIIILVMNLLVSCVKETVPVVTTASVSDITGISATSGGTIIDDGGVAVISNGLCWSINNSPTVADNKTTDGSGNGTFSSNITGLNGSTKYYVRAYATNSVGTGYGNEVTFTTLPTIPSGTSSAVTNLTASSATLNGTVNANNYSTTVSFEYGTTTNYGSTATAKESPVSGNTDIQVSADITGLIEVTTYHCRVKAVNSYGTTYSNDMTFKTLGQVPTSTTLAATNITSVAVTVNGTVNANYLSSTVIFEYGLTTNYGNTANANQSPVTGNANTDVSAYISGLGIATTYHYRVKATNSLGTSYGGDMTFTTLGQIPTVTNLALTNITQTNATFNGNVNANGYSTTVTFEYGITSDYGSTATANQSPITGNTDKSVSVDITGLTTGSTYHFRIVAINSLGTTTSDDMQFIANYVLGQNSAGGIIFYIDNTGKHGLVCAPFDQGSYPWGCEGTRIGGTSDAFGTGTQNTALIVANCSDICAAKICSDLELSGYNDWYLPSRGELGLMYNNLKVNGYGGFANDYYWSSSEYYSIVSNYAYQQYFVNGALNQYGNKDYAYYVRAVRAF